MQKREPLVIWIGDVINSLDGVWWNNLCFDDVCDEQWQDDEARAKDKLDDRATTQIQVGTEYLYLCVSITASSLYHGPNNEEDPQQPSEQERAVGEPRWDVMHNDLWQCISS